MSKRPSLILLGAALLLACPGPGKPDAGGQGGGGGSTDGGEGDDGGAASGTVVLVSERHLTSAGSSTVRSSYTSSTLRAHLPLAGGQYLVVEGSWVDGGVGTFSSRFAGDWLLEWDQGTFVQVSGEQIDLGTDLLGRPAVAFAEATPPTTLRAKVVFSKPYSAYDDVQLILANTSSSVFEANYYGVSLADGGFSQPDEQQTSVDWTLDWTGLPLLDPAQGDGLIATHLTYQHYEELGDAGIVWQRVLTSTLVPAPIAITQGSAALLSGTFSPAAQDNTQAIDWRRSQVNALKAQVSPAARVADEAYYVSVIPWSGERGFYAEAPDLCVVQAYGANELDVARTLTFANPYPPSWPRLGGTFTTFEVKLDLGGGQTVTEHVSVEAVDLLTRFTAGPQGVRLSPPTNLKVDGQAAEGPLQLATLNPTVSWGSPETGSAERYSLSVQRLAAADSTTVGTVLVPETVHSLVVPRGLLQPGERYAFVLDAWRDGQVPTASAPFHYGFPYARAGTITGVLKAP